MFSRQTAEIERRSSVRSLADEQGVAADVAAALDRGEPVVALLTGGSRLGRLGLTNRLCAHLMRKSTRVIRIGGVGGEPVNVRGFCHLLIAASSEDSVAGDPAERLASLFTNPRAGVRSLTLIVENADALSTDALAFVARLATASSAQPLRMQVLLVGSHALQVRLDGVGRVAVTRLDGRLPTPGLKPVPVRQRARKLRLALTAVGCLAGVAVFAAIRSGDDDRLSAKTGSVFEPPPPPALSFAAFAIGEVSSTVAPSESAPEFSSTLPQVQSSFLAVPGDAASPPAGVVPGAGDAVSKRAPEPQITIAALSTEALPGPESGASSMTVAELLARGDALLASVDALLARRPAGDAAPPGTEPPASLAASLEPAPTPVHTGETDRPSATAPASAPPDTGPPASLAASSEPAPVLSEESGLPSATAPASAPPDTERPAIPLTHAEPLPAPVQQEQTAVPSTAAAADDARPAVEPAAVPVWPATTAVPSAAPAAEGAVQPVTRPRRPPSGASPAAVAAMLARGDALIAIGDVAAARLVYQRAAALDSARAATSTGKTYDPRFLQAMGAIGVVADPDAAAAWYRKGTALGDEDAAPLMGGLDVKASQ